ncbi:MAG: acyl-CoA dehydrogenase, partial [Paraburkholderia sp.]
MSWFFLVLVVAAAALVYLQARASWWLAFLIVWVAAAHLSGAAGPLATAILAIVFVLPALVLTAKPLRRAWLSKSILEIFRKILPAMSPTERDAIEAGTVWWDAAL